MSNPVKASAGGAPRVPCTRSRPTAPAGTAATAAAALALGACLVGTWVPSSATADTGVPGGVTEVAAEFAAAIDRRDAGAILALFADDALIKERTAVVAAGPARVEAWVRRCIAVDFALEWSSLRIQDGTATWTFADWTGCYWRIRPGAETVLWPGPEVHPAEGRLTIGLEPQQPWRITSLVMAYDDAWQARYLRSLAAPVIAARARATATVAAGRPPATAGPAPAAEAAPAAPTGIPDAPDTQRRTTPSGAPWLVALGLVGVAAIRAALSAPRSA